MTFFLTTFDQVYYRHSPVVAAYYQCANSQLFEVKGGGNHWDPDLEVPEGRVGGNITGRKERGTVKWFGTLDCPLPT